MSLDRSTHHTHPTSSAPALSSSEETHPAGEMVSGITVPPLHQATCCQQADPPLQPAFPHSFHTAISLLLPAPQPSDHPSSFSLTLAQALSCFPQDIFIREMEACRWESMPLQATALYPLLSSSPLTMEMMVQSLSKASLPSWVLPSHLPQ